MAIPTVTLPTPSPTPTPPNPGWKIGLIAVGIVIMFVGILFTAVVTRISATKKSEGKKALVAAQKATNNATASSVEVLELMFEGITPCSTRIDYRAQIWGDGPEFWVQFPGVKDPVLFGRGKFTAPSGVETGETFFKAADPARPVVVRVYKKITVQEGR